MHPDCNRQIAVFADQPAWVAAYAAWYKHFLAMQPVLDRLAERWAHNMTENTLIHFHQRTDKPEIVQMALREIDKNRKRDHYTTRLPSTPAPAPAQKNTPAQISLF